MTQQEFLRQLKRLLRHAPEAERAEALRYYREYLQDAGLQPGQDVTPLVGTPEQAARGVMADAQIRQNQAQAQMHRRMEIGRIVLAIVLFLPMVIALALLVAFGMTGLGLVLGGIAALLSMLNSCSSGVSVVNIDNGFGAGYQAALIDHVGRWQA